MSYSTLIQITTPQAAQQCAALDLYFTAAGGPVIVTLGPLDDAGLPAPAQAQQRLEMGQIKTDGTATRVLLAAPVLLQARTSYAICVSAADTTTALAVAQVGEAGIAGGWITAPAADVGQLLEVNASGIVTRHSNRMLRFDMLAVQYTASSKTVTLGTQAVDRATMLLVNAGAQQPDAGARIGYAIALLDGSGAVARSIAADSGQPVRLDTPHTGDVTVKATLRVGSSGLGPVLEPAPALAVGSLLDSGDYITPVIATAGGTDLRVIFEGDIPPGAAVAVHAQIAGSSAWQIVPFASSSPQTAGIIEMTHRLQGVNGTGLRLRLTLTGTSTARPKVHNLRAAIL